MTAERTSPMPTSSMDKASRERLEAILAKEPTALTEGDMAFLYGRRGYLTAEQRKDYGVDKAPAAPAAAGDQYDTMDKNALKAEAKKRGLPVSGKTAELRERLRAAQ